ncbi:MAG: GIY-YIG nuclease family protein [Pseudomonadota bacterium]
MFTLQDVLTRAGIAPQDVNVMLHSPRDGDMLTMLPGLVRTRRHAMETYQAAHSPLAERTLSQGRPWVASFVKTGPGRAPGTSAMLFAGLYQNHGGTRTPRAEIEANEEVQWLYRSFGAFAEIARDDWTHWTWFDLRLDDALADLQGRLLIETRLTQTYVRLAENIDAPIAAIHATSTFDAGPPPWRDMVISGGLLRALPLSWAAKLREWRGIYHILDASDGARYVGAAYGADNLLGRWQQHVAGAAGITAKLRARDPLNFRFSILERLAPDLDAREVTRREQTWMTRLHTRGYGLNA